MNDNEYPPDPHESPGGERAVPTHEAAAAVGAPAGEAPNRSRTVAWIGMAAVAVALGLLWLVPVADDHSHDRRALETGAGIGEEDAAAIGKPARLDFTMKDMNGVDVKLASFKGRVILLNFWATWCGPCKVEIPDLVALQEQYRDDLVVLGVQVQDEMNSSIPAFAKEFKINYPLLDGNNREDVEIAFGPFYGIPATVVIDRDGVIAMKHAGIRSKEQLQQVIEPLVGATGDSE
jgi:thiol-disulfide isomerase/thioredoxin